MSVRGWGRSAGIAAGVSAGAAAAQVGLGYGLGVLGWLPDAGDVGAAAWLMSLTWAVWIAASSTVGGALAADRLTKPAPVADTSAAAAPREDAPADAPARPSGVDPEPVSGPTRRTSLLWRLALSLAGAVGATLSVVLVAVPARQAAGVVGPDAQPTAAGYALVGIALGLLVAVWALSSPAVARNVVATVGWQWAVAVAMVVVTVATGREPTSAPLGGWPAWATGSEFWFRGYVFGPAAAFALGSALLIGALAAWSVARRPNRRVGATVSGAVGPAVVAAAYLIASQRDGLSPEQVSAHLTAPYAVIAGLAGSALAAGIAQHRAAIAQHRAARNDFTLAGSDSGESITGSTSSITDPEPDTGPARQDADTGSATPAAGVPTGNAPAPTANTPDEPATPKSSPTGPKPPDPKPADPEPTEPTSSAGRAERSSRAGRTARRGAGQGSSSAVPDQRTSPDPPE